jgi:DNA-binding CsgD family transcriptional regulator
MSTRLKGVLSEPAAALYERLLVGGGLPLADVSADGGISEAATELVDRGFARNRHVGRAMLVPVEPVRAIDNAILVAQRQIFEHYRLLVSLRDDLTQLQRLFLSTGSTDECPTDLVRILTEPSEIGALSVELALSARHDVASLETATFRTTPDPRSARVLPAEVVERGVTFRNIYERAMLEIDGAREIVRRSVEFGWQCRVYSALPMKMVLVDERAALLPLSPTGMEGAMLIRAPVVVSALRMYFELLWHRSTEIDGKPHELLTDIQRDVLRLLMTGLTDNAIGRHLGVSERTIRRQVSSLFELAAVDNRVALAVTAMREGWAT